MNFLNPIMLYGLGAAALPLIIHLLTRRRAREVPYPSIEIIERMKTTRMRRLKLRQILLIILRTLAILSIILAFARPTIQGSFKSGGKTSTVIILDGSASMRYIHEGEMIHDRAKRAAAEIIGMLGKGDRGAVIDAGLDPVVLGDGLSGDTSRLLQYIGESAPGYGVMNAQSAFNLAESLLDGVADPNREIIFITDGASNAWPDSLAATDGSPPGVYTILAGPERRAGAVIDRVRLDNRLVVQGKALDFTVTGRLAEGTDVADVSFFVNGSRTGKERMSRQSDGFGEARFSFTPDAFGRYSIEAVIDDGRFVPGESRRLVLRVPERPGVLIVVGEDSDGYFLRKSLDPDPDRSMFEIETVKATELTPGHVRRADVIVLSGVNEMNGDTYRSLVSAVAERGAGLVVFTPMYPDENLYADAMFRDLFPAKIDGRISLDAVSGNTVAVSRFNLDHPVLRGVSGSGSFRKPRVNAYIKLSTPPSATTIAGLDDGSPAVMEAVCGNGGVIVFAVELTRYAGDLPMTGIFIPLFMRSVQYLASSEHLGGHYLTGDDIEEKITVVTDDGSVTLKMEDGASQSLETEPVAGGLRPKNLFAETPGFYSISAGGEERTRFSVDMPSDESLFYRTGHEKQAEAFKNIRWKTIDIADNLADTLVRERIGRELFSLFIALALMFLALEMFVARME